MNPTHVPIGETFTVRTRSGWRVEIAVEVPA